MENYLNKLTQIILA